MESPTSQFSAQVFKKHMFLPKHYLSPNPLFTLNRVLQEILDGLKLDELNLVLGENFWVVPTLFSKETKTFHLACIDDHVWGGEHQDQKELHGFIDELMWFLVDVKLNPTDKNKAFKFLSSTPEIEDAKRHFDDCLEALELSKRHEQDHLKALEQKGLRQKFKKDHSRKLSIALGIRCSDGSIQKAFYEQFIHSLLTIYHSFPCNRSQMLSGLMYQGLEDFNSHAPDRFEGTPAAADSLVYKGSFWRDNQELCAVGDYVQLFDQEGFPFLLKLTELFYRHGSSDLSRLSSNPILIVPVYDVWLGERGFGGLWGNLILTFPSKDKRTEFVEKRFKQFQSFCGILASELAMVAVASSASKPIVPPYDLLKHFLSELVALQDWERAVVMIPNETFKVGAKQQGNGGGKPHLYCYKRSEEQGTIRAKWEYCNNCIDHQNCMATNGTNRWLRWKDRIGGKGIWDTDIIPELSSEELDVFLGIQCFFEFPQSAFVPPSEEATTRELFEYQIIQQQLELLRVLIPKVRARRSALRNVVSAIMGRNMSHNIGSHVLARYSNVVGRAGEQRKVPTDLWADIDKGSGELKKKASSKDVVTPGVEDHRGELLRYLQRRMDFIADVATADVSHWGQPLNLCDVLSVLDFDKASARINENVEAPLYRPILLSYITGKEGINATVRIGSGLGLLNPYFECPGGEVGAHAVYVILENVIRNSAKHNSDGYDRIELEVDVQEDVSEKNESFWKVTIIDRQSAGDARIEVINHTLTTEKILTDDGRPNAKYWGLREMQICAQYLRGLPMGDLESEQATPPVIQAVSAIDRQGTACLAYQIYLQRPKLCAIVPARESGGPQREIFHKELGAKGVDVLLPMPDPNDLKGYAFVLIEESTGTHWQLLEDGKTMALVISRNEEKRVISKVELPVRALIVETSFLADVFEIIRSGRGNVDAWLDKLHQKVWLSYRDKRPDWRGKEVKALVGWEKDAAREVEDQHSPFSHALITEAKDHYSTYREFGDVIFKEDQIGCAWLDHASNAQFSQDGNPKIICAATPAKYDPQPFVFGEVIDSQSPHRAILQKQKEGALEGHELLAAALARVIILDERVQSEIERQYRTVDYARLWPCMGLWIPFPANQIKHVDSPQATDLNQPKFDEIKLFLQRPTQMLDQMQPEFLILHLSILERLKDTRGDDSETDTLEALLEGTSVGVNCEIVIVTGRGVPSVSRHHQDTKPLKVRYLPISSLLEYIIARPSKLALMRALWSAATVG